MAEYLSPRQFADAIGVSESTVKRWVDSGHVQVDRTLGGHRRIPVREALRFIHQQQMEGKSERETVYRFVDTDERVGQKCFDALHEGNATQLQNLMVSCFASGMPLETICDDVIHAGYKMLRAECNHPSEECHVLHRALEVARAGMLQLRRLSDAERPNVPPRSAMGGDIGYEVDSLPTALTAAFLAHHGYSASDLGGNLPREVVSGFLSRPCSLLWLSASGPADRECVKEITEQAIHTANRPPILLIGELFGPFASGFPDVHVLSTITELRRLLETLHEPG